MSAPVIILDKDALLTPLPRPQLMPKLARWQLGRGVESGRDTAKGCGKEVEKLSRKSEGVSKHEPSILKMFRFYDFLLFWERFCILCIMNVYIIHFL